MFPNTTDQSAEITRDTLEQMLKRFDELSDTSGIMTIELAGACLVVRNAKSGKRELMGMAPPAGAFAYLR